MCFTVNDYVDVIIKIFDSRQDTCFIPPPIRKANQSSELLYRLVAKRPDLLITLDYPLLTCVVPGRSASQEPWRK